MLHDIALYKFNVDIDIIQTVTSVRLSLKILSPKFVKCCLEIEG